MLGVMSNKNTENNSHLPVLLTAVLDVLRPRSGESYLDLTAGRGGHAREVLNRVGDGPLLTLVDRDDQAVSSLQTFVSLGARVIKDDFAHAATNFVSKGQSFDIILLDLGVSSPQLDQAERGFSFRASGPLDMRMDQSQTLSAKELVNHTSENELISIIKEYGQEPKARRIAKMIVQNRPFSTTEQLAEAIEHKLGRRGKIHPATRTFQALRIAVNDELGQLQATLALIPKLLSPGGRVAIISFHSLEDRLVKRALKEFSEGYEAELKLLTKKPIPGTQDVFNPRARSAKLRAAAKIKNERGK